MSGQIEQFRQFASYNRRFNEVLYALAGELTDAERKRDLKAFFRSVHGTLNHLLWADRLWLARFRDCGVGDGVLHSAKLLDEPGRHADELYADFGQLADERRATDAAIEAWTARLTPEAIAGTMRYSNMKGAPRAHPAWFAIAHFFNHQTHHRGQLTALLFQLGKDPGVTDLIAYYQPKDA